MITAVRELRSRREIIDVDTGVDLRRQASALRHRNFSVDIAATNIHDAPEPGIEVSCSLKFQPCKFLYRPKARAGMPDSNAARFSASCS